MNNIAIVGVGLIGASFALALREAGFAGQIAGVSSPRSIAAGINSGAISRGISLAEAAEWADLLYLSQPIEHILTTLVQLGPLARPDCLITDAGSTKTTIVETARQYLPETVFLGGHPMAGKEQRGAEAAEANLFRGRPYVLTPLPSPANHSEEFRSWLRLIGADVLDMDARRHDRTVALTSHLPQLLSTALACTLANQQSESVTQVFGPGLLDMTRLSLSSPEVWGSVVDTNKEAIEKALAEFAGVFSEMQRELASSNLGHRFVEAAEFSSRIRKPAFTS